MDKRPVRLTMSIKVIDLAFKNYRGGGTELLTMLALADWCDDEGGRLFPSIKAVAKKIRLSESQARRSIHKLIELGYLSVLKNHDGGRNSETRHYQINLIRLSVPRGVSQDLANSAIAKIRESSKKTKPVTNDVYEGSEIEF